MPLLALALVPLFALALIALIPVSLVLRYRAGTARQRARGWLTALNAVGFSLSSAMMLLFAGLTGVWVPHAFAYTLAGLTGGCVLGLLGLALTRWEAEPQALYYTPNRPLLLTITLVVVARMAYGVFRSWHAWRATPAESSWLAEAGVAGSLAAGAVVLGYYLAYWTGVWLLLRRHRRARLGADRRA
jgi:hypothetical protein